MMRPADRGSPFKVPATDLRGRWPMPHRTVTPELATTRRWQLSICAMDALERRGDRDGARRLRRHATVPDRTRRSAAKTASASDRWDCPWADPTPGLLGFVAAGT